jgi:hypothetical protein
MCLINELRIPTHFKQTHFLVKPIFRVLRHALFFTFLTLITQIGGLIWLLSLYLNKMVQKRRPIRGLRWAIFLVLYTLTTIFIVPPAAYYCCDRVPLPVFSNPNLEPENVLFAFFNRTYVRIELRKTLEEVAAKMQTKYPGSAVWYMDANFPFIDGYPLEPHLSHRDGKKIDLSFYWKTAKTGLPIRKNPSPTGYGLWAEPLPGEFDYAQHCIEKGNWYIGYDEQLGDWGYDKKDYTLDGDRTREMLRLLVEHPAIEKILIQPHLKKRLDLERYDKVRAQGCLAARHDDHVHVQLR